MDNDFNGFDTTFLKNLIDFFKLSSTAVFTFSFKSHENLLYNDTVSLPFHGRKDETIF